MFDEKPTPLAGDASIQEAEVTASQEEVPAEEPAAPKGDAPSEDASIELSTIAAALGLEEADLDVDEDGTVVFATKIDGKQAKAKASEVKTSYQLKGHLDNENREVAQLKEQLKAQQIEQSQAHAQRLGQLEEIVQLAWSELDAEARTIDWNTLRQDDPAEFAAKQAEVTAKRQALQQRFQAIQQEKQNSYASFNKQYLTEQEEKIYTAIPEWKDNTIGEKELTEVRKYGVSLGLTPQEAGSLVRAADIIAYRKAKKYDELQSAKPEVTKLIRRAPKVSKPGQSKPSAKPMAIEDVFYGTS